MKLSELDIPGVPPVRPPPRFFLAHAKHCDDVELEVLVQAVSVILNRLSLLKT